MSAQRGRPRKTMSKDSAPTMRERPVHHEGVAGAKHIILDEMEQAAQRRIEAGDRVSLSPKLKLQWNDCEPGFNYQWASDSENYPISLQAMCDAGYTFVRYKHGQRSGEPIIQNSRGCSLYLMRCPDEYFQADQARIHKKSVAQHKEIMQVGAREYAGQSKALGKGKPVEMEFKETPDAIRLMEGDDE